MSYMLSTVDNPFNPFKEWEEWLAFDTAKGYNCCLLLDRFAFTSDGLPETINNEITEQAIDDIIKDDLLGLYVKIGENDKIISVASPIDAKAGGG